MGMKKYSLLSAMTLLFVIAALALAPTPTQAEVKVYVRSCLLATDVQEFFAFNGKDSDCTVSADSATLDSQEVATLKCKGQGKGRCKITMAEGFTKDCGDLDRVNVDNGDTLIVFDAKLTSTQKIRSSAETSADAANCCGDQISDALCDDRFDQCTAYDFDTTKCGTYMECMYNGGTDATCR